MPRLEKYNCINSANKALFIIVGGFLSTTALAAEPVSHTNDWHWHGFANWGVIKTSDNNFLGNSENWSDQFHDAGLGGSWKPHSRVQFSGQVIYRRAGKTSHDGLQLDYGFVDANFINTMDYGLGMRAGRIKNPYGFHNETRDIASNRPSILLPQSIYLDSLRQLFHTMNGLSSYARFQQGNTLLNLDVAYGQPLIDDRTENVILNTELPGNIENEKTVVARATLEDDSGQWRVGYSHVNLSSDYQAAPLDFAIDGNANITANLLSAEYNWKNWQVSAEYQQREIEYRDIFYSGANILNKGESYYVQASYQFTPKWKAFTRYDAYFQLKNDRNGKKSQAATGLPARELFSKDIAAGIHYDINKHWSIAAEYHRIKGVAWLAKIENSNLFDKKDDWDLFTAQVSLKF